MYSNHEDEKEKKKMDYFFDTKVSTLIRTIHIWPVKWELLVRSKTIGISLYVDWGLREKDNIGGAEKRKGRKRSVIAENRNRNRIKISNLFTITYLGAKTTTFERQNFNFAASI